ncbi:MAG: hypothetical protein KY475_01765 [Planctomycetes bacterium]|nr:hypothetical protein [Planctomycetota bacterium]
MSLREERSRNAGRAYVLAAREALSADYVLIYRNTKLGVVESEGVGRGTDKASAKRRTTAAKLQIRFANSTNGQGVYAIDMQEGQPKEINHAFSDFQQYLYRTVA